MQKKDYKPSSRQGRGRQEKDTRSRGDSQNTRRTASKNGDSTRRGPRKEDGADWREESRGRGKRLARGEERNDWRKAPKSEGASRRTENMDDRTMRRSVPKGDGTFRRQAHKGDAPVRHAAPKEDGTTRLNKYIANAGICSRREADKLISAGSVMVNGKVVTEMGYKVKAGDVVNYGGETLRSERKRYFLLNKPKGYITTVDDPQERQTVMMLIDGACPERIYPVGRLDRNTTGLLLFTNDGELARKLTHPSTGVYKIYHVELDKPVSRDDMRQMLEGIELEDGMIKVDDVQYDKLAADRRVVGIELHSGKNRIVRRIFEHLGYNVHKLDRTVFAGLTKKDLPRGRYRELTEKEVGFLKMI